MLCGTQVLAQTIASSSKATITIVSSDSFSLTTPAQAIDAPFTVQITDPQGNPIQGVTITFTANEHTCPDADPACLNPPAGLFGEFSPAVDNVVSDSNGLATASGFVGGTQSGIYTVVASLNGSLGPVDEQLLDPAVVALNVFFNINQSFKSDVFAIQTGITGSWYDPSESGQGFNIEILADNQMTVYFYTFDAQGNNIWLVGYGDAYATLPPITMYETRGGFFSPKFDAANISRTIWGTLTLDFTDCNTGTATWVIDAAQASNFSNGSLPIKRITSIPGLTCQ